jgi:hypothetical protein
VKAKIKWQKARHEIHSHGLSLNPTPRKPTALGHILAKVSKLEKYLGKESYN